jgi:hypothetical protein
MLSQFGKTRAGTSLIDGGKRISHYFFGHKKTGAKCPGQ